MRSRIRPGAYRGRSLRLKQLHTSGSTTPGIMELCRLELHDARRLSPREYENDPYGYEDS
jgi:hypothetical protein